MSRARALVLCAAASAMAFALSGAPAGAATREPSRAADLPATAPPAFVDSGAEVDVADYTLHAWLDTDRHTVHGEGTVRFRNTSSEPVTELWFHLYLNAFKNERSTFLREPAAGFRGSAPVTDWGTIDLRRLSLRDDVRGEPVDLLAAVQPREEPAEAASDEDETEVRVPLHSPLLPGESLTLDMGWDDKLPSILERTGYSGSFHFVGQWFPKLARLEPNGVWAHFPFHHLGEFYADFGTYDVTLDVPETFVIGATGQAVESRRENGRLIERHVEKAVHDFAWSAWDRFQTREEKVGDVAVKVLFPPGYEAAAERELAIVRFALPYFGERYGAYPYSGLTVIHPPESASEAGGMEYPTLITTGGAWLEPRGVHLLEQVTVHELGHQYFYGLVATNEVRWPFLDEGVNSYAEADVLRAAFGDGSALSLGGVLLSDEAVQAVFANAAAHDAPVAQPAYEFRSGAEYSALVYERTAAVLETARRVFGDDAMRAALGAYAREFRFRHPGPEDFLRTIADRAGGDAAGMVRRALFDEGWVDFAVTEVVCRSSHAPRGLFDREGSRQLVDAARSTPGAFDGWVTVARRGTLSLPVEVELRLADGTRSRVPWDGRDTAVRIPFRGASRLVAAVVDPDHRVLLDDDLTNNHARSVDADGAGAPLSLERATYWAALLVQVVSP